jgi:hypothetical protein
MHAITHHYIHLTFLFYFCILHECPKKIMKRALSTTTSATRTRVQALWRMTQSFFRRLSLPPPPCPRPCWTRMLDYCSDPDTPKDLLLRLNRATPTPQARWRATAYHATTRPRTRAGSSAATSRAGRPVASARSPGPGRSMVSRRWTTSSTGWSRQLPTIAVRAAAYLPAAVQERVVP